MRDDVGVPVSGTRQAAVRNTERPAMRRHKVIAVSLLICRRWRRA